MSINLKSLLLTSACMLMAPSVLAATAGNAGSGANSYLFIENAVDNEYFITSNTRTPRFSGANIWTRYNNGQEALGYMGWALAASNRYVDFWITDSPIATPFVGLRCRQDGGNCPSVGHIPATYLDSQGLYHTMNGNSINNGNSSYGTFSPSSFEYFRQLPVGSTNAFELNFCYTTTNYDYESGVRCKDITTGGATWRYYTQTVTKVGHLNLLSTGSMSEIMVASDGSASVTGSGDLCNVGVVGNVNGVICKMVSYNYQQTQQVTNQLFISMIIDTATLGFTPGNRDIQFSGDNANWKLYNATNTVYSDIFTTGGQYVYVFLSNTFFRNVLNSGNNITNNDALFTFAFNNTAYPTSGYYQFTASNQVNITPREYGISIISSDGSSKPKNAGNIGSAQPVEFEYKVTTSAVRQADSITAQVTGDSTTINGIPYCLFTSTDGTYSVPIPAYLSYTAQSGSTVTERNSCAEAPIDMTAANWVQTAWDAAVNDGFFYTTTLKLLFPMNDSRSRLTVAGDDWMGTVSASGEVKVTATWVGVDK
ncbi:MULTISPECIES: fimbrial protein [Winslowiella]|uniref:fimbrial protein n=1 Tax=Winslowiella TaxID=2997349 RepID=UPI0028BDE864|nr:fimbrial protein [Winslowiella toletana]WNN45934.1 fimbrial protein [Winslowiella toletana]